MKIGKNSLLIGRMELTIYLERFPDCGSPVPRKTSKNKEGNILHSLLQVNREHIGDGPLVFLI
ncbi:MAG: hypothetical protein V1915_01335 [Candidatus Bathyarchaeota archaeon]